jgi:hypothetical protein
MSHTPSRHQRIQLWIVGALTSAYAILATVVGEAPLAALIGLGMTMLSGWLGYSLGPRREVGFEIFLVWFVAFMTFAGVVLSTTDQSLTVVGLIAVTGIFCTLGSYSIWRLPLPAQEYRDISFREATVAATRTGFAMACVICVIATIAIAIGAGGAVGDSTEPVFTLRGYVYLMLAYLTAGVGGGFVIGFLRPFGRWPIGAMVIGMPVATLGYGAVGLAMLFMGDPDSPSTLGETAAASVGIGCAAGPMGALWLRNGKQRRAGRLTRA